MKVLHLIMSLKTGGAEKLLVDIMNNTKDVEAHLCVVNNKVNENMLKEIKDINKVKLIRRNEGSKNIFKLVELINYVGKLKPNIIHCHNVASLKLACMIKRLFKNIQLVYTIHGTKILQNNSYAIKLINQNDIKIICISEAVKEEVTKLTNKKDNIFLIQNGIDVRRYQLSKVKHEGINIACVGRLEIQKKGQDILINAMKNVLESYDAKLFLAGDYNESYVKDDYAFLKNRINELKINDSVIFCGNVSNIPEFLRDKDMLVLPSRIEGFGLAIIEGMAAEIDVIASDIDGPKEIIKDKFGYLFKCEDHNDLAEKIKYCIENRGQYTKAALKNVIKYYSIEEMCRKYYEVYMVG